MATFPLHSCRMDLLRGRDGGARSLDAHDGDGARFRAAVEADAATGATLALVLSGVDAVVVQFRAQEQHLGRTGFDAQAAAFAFVLIDSHVAARNRHNTSFPDLLT